MQPALQCVNVSVLDRENSGVRDVCQEICSFVVVNLDNLNDSHSSYEGVIIPPNSSLG